MYSKLTSYVRLESKYKGLHQHLNHKNVAEESIQVELLLSVDLLLKLFIPSSISLYSIKMIYNPGTKGESKHISGKKRKKLTD